MSYVEYSRCPSQRFIRQILCAPGDMDIIAENRRQLLKAIRFAAMFGRKLVFVSLHHYRISR